MEEEEEERNDEEEGEAGDVVELSVWLSSNGTASKLFR